MGVPGSGHFFGNPQPATVELAEHLCDRLADLRRRRARGKPFAVLPGLLYRALKLLGRAHSVFVNCTIRRAASRHSPVSATSAMRTEFVPGVASFDSRA